MITNDERGQCFLYKIDSWTLFYLKLKMMQLYISGRATLAGFHGFWTLHKSVHAIKTLLQSSTANEQRNDTCDHSQLKIEQSILMY